MYSERLSWSFVKNPFSKLIEQKRAEGTRLLDLTLSNPTLVFKDYPYAAICDAYARVKDFTYRPDPSGRFESRVAIAEYHKRRDIFISPEQIVLTASTSEAYSLLFKLFANPGDEILTPLPSYPLFEYLAALDCVAIVPYRLLYDGPAWFIDFADVVQRISSRTRAVIVVNPNNPTGSRMKQFELARLLELAEHYRLPVISDEVFMDYDLEGAPDTVKTVIGRKSVLSFSLNGLSKTAGMPQMKLAWIVIDGPESEREMARERLELVLDTYLSVGTPVQNALPELLHLGEQIQAQIRERIVQNFRVLRDVLNGSAARCLETEAGWSAIIELPRSLSEEEWITRLVSEHGVVVQPGYFFDLESEAYIVVSLITAPEEFREGVRRVRELTSVV